MNIIDLAITETGSAEGLVDFLKTNPNLDVNGVIQGGTEFISDSDQVRNSKMVDYFGNLQVRVNTGDLGVPEPPYLSPIGGYIGKAGLEWVGGNPSSKHEVWRRKKGGTEFFKVATVDAGLDSYLDEGLEHGATYEYKVRVAEVGSLEFSNTVEVSTLAPDLVIRSNSPENVSIAGTGTWVHEGGFSYLFATSGKEAVTALYLCDAQVQGVVDLSSSSWTNMSYVCVNNATNLDLRLGDWINRDSVQVKAVNSYVFKEALKPFIAHVRAVNGTASNTGRVLDIGVITLDLDSQADAQLMDDIDFLTNNGWDVKIVYGKLLSFKVQTRTFVDLRGRVAENAGEELWMKGGEVFESGYVANTETVELYHSDIDALAEVDLSFLGLNVLDLSQSVFDATQARVINVQGNALAVDDVVNQLEVTQDLTIDMLGVQSQAKVAGQWDYDMHVNRLAVLEQVAIDYGVNVVVNKFFAGVQELISAPLETVHGSDYGLTYITDGQYICGSSLDGTVYSVGLVINGSGNFEAKDRLWFFYTFTDNRVVNIINQPLVNDMRFATGTVFNGYLSYQFSNLGVGKLDFSGVDRTSTNSLTGMQFIQNPNLTEVNFNPLVEIKTNVSSIGGGIFFSNCPLLENAVLPKTDYLQIRFCPATNFVHAIGTNYKRLKIESTNIESFDWRNHTDGNTFNILDYLYVVDNPNLHTFYFPENAYFNERFFYMYNNPLLSVNPFEYVQGTNHWGNSSSNRQRNFSGCALMDAEAVLQKIMQMTTTPTTDGYHRGGINMIDCANTGNATDEVATLLAPPHDFSNIVV